MIITTPQNIEAVAWEGELIAPEAMKGVRAERPRATLGQPVFWPVVDALEIKTGEQWIAPIADADFWLLRLACTLHPAGRFSSIVEAQLTLSLEPKNRQTSTVYAFSLFPERLTAENPRELTVGLGPKLKFGTVEAEAGNIGAKIVYRKVFPVIQSFGAGESAPYWLFKPHSAHPLEGSQFVYAVVAAGTASGGIQGEIALTVSIDTDFGIIRLGLPREAKAAASFTMP